MGLTRCRLWQRLWPATRSRFWPTTNDRAGATVVFSLCSQGKEEEALLIVLQQQPLPVPRCGKQNPTHVAQRAAATCPSAAQRDASDETDDSFSDCHQSRESLASSARVY